MSFLKKTISVIMCLLIVTAICACENATQERKAESLTVTGNKLQYEFGEGFSTEGLTVKVNFSDKTRETLSASDYKVDSKEFDKGKAGNYKITVTVDKYGLSHSYYVEVKEKEQMKMTWNDDKCLKILSIGNSMSYCTTELAWDVAKGLGVDKVRIYLFWRGGSEISQHVQADVDNNANFWWESRINDNGTWMNKSGLTLSQAIAMDDWDYVTIQEHSSKSGTDSGFEKIDDITSLVKEKCTNPDVQCVVLQPVAYDKYDRIADAGAKTKLIQLFDGDPSVLYQKQVENCLNKLYTDPTIAGIVPTGTAIENTKTSKAKDNLYDDGLHLSFYFGRYIAALTYASYLTGIPVDNITYKHASMTDEELSIAKESAKNALEYPFEITRSKYV